jgi:hypothetical protein
MRLFLTATSERGKPVTKSGNDFLEMEVSIDRKPIGCLRMTHTEHDNKTEVYYYPITSNVVGSSTPLPLHKAGRVLVHEENKIAECKHIETKENGICIRCGYNTRHLTNRELRK